MKVCVCDCVCVCVCMLSPVQRTHASICVFFSPHTVNPIDVAHWDVGSQPPLWFGAEGVTLLRPTESQIASTCITFMKALTFVSLNPGWALLSMECILHSGCHSAHSIELGCARRVILKA